MQSTTEIRQQHPFAHGLHDGIPIAIGYIPIAITFGFIAKSTGLSFMECIMMSLFVYAGASQYMALDMIGKQFGSIEIILTTFIVNIRHFLMSASLNEKVEKDHLLKKAVYAFGVTDETFSVAAVKEDKISTGYMFGLNFIAYLSWVACSGIGYIVGSKIPELFQDGMSIALYAMFIGLLVPSLKTNGKVLYLVGLSACLNFFFLYYQVLSKGWSIVFATLISSILVELVVRIKKGRGKIDE